MRVLLVSPGFHGYHSAISAALTSRGHVVSTHVYDDHGGVVGRTWHQVRDQLPRKVGAGSLRAMAREETAKTAAAVARVRPEAAVVIKGDTLGQQFWDAIDGVPRVTWLYDEVRRTSYSGARLAEIGPLATYSATDAAEFRSCGWDARLLPLAFDHHLVPEPTARRDPHITFVGARYPPREQVLTTLHEHGVPVRAYGRDWSSHPLDRLRTWRIRTPGVPAGRDVSRVEAYDVMASSAGTLNLHGDQDGFTMRTFEAAGVGGLQLIDRDDVGEVYEPGSEVLTWSDTDELVELCRLAVSDRSWADAIRAAARARTLAEHTFDHRVAVLEAAWDTV